MCEERGIIQQCVGKGMDSEGFEVYLQVAGTGLGDRYDRYCSYIFCVFDEIAVDLGILFDRFSPFGLLFPREATLNDLVEILTIEGLKHLWAEDETIGWIYQYYNDPGERKKMRKASAAPRNSRELAVRNQFFTPRYVVEFLTDNTLGRIWYEMTRGETRLVDQCRYLVRRPSEIFLAKREAVHEMPNQENLSQEEFLNQPLHIPHRPLKDPREIRLLDPACGSMHFGLYAFDIFETIYAEAWDNGTFPALKEAYPTKDEFLKDVPRLIIEHNIHGIDIDPRAVQIAGISLWLHAQKTWQAQGVKPVERPSVRHSNVVCAEPMPGSPDMLEDFIKALDPPLLGELLKIVFNKMQLAGEAGSLLKIEREIRTAIDEAKNDWKRTDGLLPGFENSSKSAGFPFLSSGFWETAEDRLLGALRTYAEQVDVDSYQRRLFADDAARGFSFIDLCRKRYDAVVMNPPFGEPSITTAKYIKRNYSNTFIDILAAFIQRATTMRIDNGIRIGALTSRACLYTKTLSNWRQTEFFKSVESVADMGGGVLDGAMVFACASVFNAPIALQEYCNAFDLRNSQDRESDLHKLLQTYRAGGAAAQLFIKARNQLSQISGSRFLYNIPDSFWQWSQSSHSLVSYGGSARAGSTTYDDFRFLRLAWEISPREAGWNQTWVYFSKGGSFETFYNDIHLVTNWHDDGREVGEFNRIGYGTNAQSRRASTFYKLSGITYPRRTIKGFSPRALPVGCIFADKGPVIFSPSACDPKFALGFWNSAPVRALVHLQVQAGSFETGVINSIPWLDQSSGAESVASLASEIWRKKAHVFQIIDTDRDFRPPQLSEFRTLSDFCRNTKERLTNNSTDAVNLCQEISNQILNAFSLPDVDLEPFEVFPEDHAIQDEIGFALPNFAGFYLAQLVTGFCFGRWDIRYATGERQAPELPDPFDPLPVCPPGMLQNGDGLPAELKDVPADYPLRISWPGILVDDENHSEDIVARVNEAIEVIWKYRAEAIEQEACEILSVSDLRDYFRKPAKFFQDHLKRYSKSRRKAPIYWPLSTASCSYTIWIYYHRLTDQTLFTCVTDYLKPKIDEVSRDIERLQKGLIEGGTAQMRSNLEQLQDLRQELIDMQDELLRVAKLPYKPNLNDGVMITASPLWRLFRLKSWQKVLKGCWEKLEGGEYEWAHLAYSIWPDRVKEKCKTDRSIAIAHDREHLCEVEVKKPKKKKIRKKSAGLF